MRPAVRGQPETLAQPLQPPPFKGGSVLISTDSSPHSNYNAEIEEGLLPDVPTSTKSSKLLSNSRDNLFFSPSPLHSSSNTGAPATATTTAFTHSSSKSSTIKPSSSPLSMTMGMDLKTCSANTLSFDDLQLNDTIGALPEENSEVIDHDYENSTGDMYENVANSSLWHGSTRCTVHTMAPDEQPVISPSLLPPGGESCGSRSLHRHRGDGFRTAATANVNTASCFQSDPGIS